MAGGQQTLKTIVVLSGRVDNSFGIIGSELTQLGNKVNGVSSQLAQYGEESLNVYKNYEDGILETRSVLARQYSSSGELNKAMSSLEEHAQAWASTTIFHTNDVASAMATAAHAGWDYDKIISGLPASMLIAQAGGMELTDSVDMLSKMMASTGTSFNQSERFIDEWARAADLVATDIPELGSAFLRLGSSAQFAKNNEELFTMLAVLANVGTVGETAGTGVRNTMMRLVAPTQKAAEAMDELGLTEEELDEIFADVDESSAAAYKWLQDMGFSPYDERGNLRGFIDIFTDLNLALEQLPSEQEQNALLAAIFPTRTLSYAKAFLNAVKDGSIYSIYQAIWGDSDGYAKEKSDVVMSGLTGALEILASKAEETQRRVGETMSPTVTSLAGWAGDIFDTINGMDETSFNALVSGAEAIALAGPGLLIAGSAFKLIGALATPGGALAAAAIAIPAIAAAVSEIEKSNLEEKFGNMDLDEDELSAAVQTIGDSFSSAYESVNAYNTALEKSMEDYTEASSTFSSNLMTKMLTGAELTEQDMTKLMGLGDDMVQAVLSGITHSTASTMSYLEVLFGGEGVAENDPNYANIIASLNESYEGATANAQALGEKLREALTAAFADGHLTPEELANIKSIVKEMNDAMLEAQRLAEEDARYAEMQKLLRRAQTAGLDEVYDYAGQIQSSRDENLNWLEDQYETHYFTSESAMRRSVENGTMTQKQMDDGLAAITQQYEKDRAQYSADYDGLLNNLWDSVLRESGLSDTYGTLGELADRVLSGEFTAEEATQVLGETAGKNYFAGEDGSKNSERSQLAQVLAHEVASYGGYQGVLDKAAYYESMGDSQTAAYFRRLYAMDYINNNGARTSLVDEDDFFGNISNPSGVKSTALTTPGRSDLHLDEYRQAFEDFIGSTIGEYSLEKARQSIASSPALQDYLSSLNAGADSDDLFNQRSALEALDQAKLNSAFGWIGRNYDLEAIGQMLGGAGLQRSAAWVLGSGENAEQYRISAKVDPVVEPGSVEAAAGEQTIPATVEPVVEAAPGEATAEQTLPATVEPIVGPGSVEAAAGEPVITATVTIKGAKEAANQAKDEIEPVFGEAVTQNIDVTDSGAAAACRQGIADTFRTPITQRILIAKVGGIAGGGKGSGNTFSKYAEGGRADEASIFGEAGPEWAIPEEHSARTASLLDAARQASGFSWPELLAMSGGLNADAGHAPTQIVYSPTIIANDATGVEQKLAEDKERLDRWWTARQLREDIAVYG